MDLHHFLAKLKTAPEFISFELTMAVIDNYYQFTPTAFRNGSLANHAGQNNGSCKILALGQLHGLSKDETLACFGTFYREDVLGNPTGDDHQNIRNLIAQGWDAVSFEGQALTQK